MTTGMATHYFNISAAKLWKLIGDFGDVKRWGSKNLKSCTQKGVGIGSQRTLKIIDGNQTFVIVDRLEEVGPRSYSYSIVSSPLPFKSYLAKMEVVEIDDTNCQLIWSSIFAPKGLSEVEAKSYIEEVYRMGFGLIETALKRV